MFKEFGLCGNFRHNRGVKMPALNSPASRLAGSRKAGEYPTDEGKTESGRRKERSQNGKGKSDWWLVKKKKNSLCLCVFVVKFQRR